MNYASCVEHNLSHITGDSQMHENDVARDVVDAAYKIHSRLGPGIYEEVYETLLEYELTKRGHAIERQKVIPIEYEGIFFERGFRADMIVDDLVILELKSVERLGKSSFKQLLTYLRLEEKRLGLLMNFGEEFIKDGIHRIVNGLTEDEIAIVEAESEK